MAALFTSRLFERLTPGPQAPAGLSMFLVQVLRLLAAYVRTQEYGAKKASSILLATALTLTLGRASILPVPGSMEHSKKEHSLYSLSTGPNCLFRS